jgi:hypothetical protein
MGFMDKMKQAQQQAAAAGMQQGGTGGGMAGMGMDANAVAYAQKAQKIYQVGIEAPGVIHAIRPTGQTDVGGGQMVDFDVSIKPASGEPYQTTIQQSMLPAQLETISEGAAITVKYDPEAPVMALIYGW